MIVISGDNVGPFKKFKLELNRFNLVFGSVGSGKSFLFRLLELIDLAYTLTHYRLTEEEVETTFSRLLLIDDGLVFESRLASGFVKKQAVNTIVRHGENYGVLKLGIDSDELAIEFKRSSTNPIRFSNIDLWSRILSIHIPQERMYSIEYGYISRIFEELSSFYERYGSESPALMMYKLVYDYKIPPLLSSYIADIVASLSYIVSSIKESELEFRVEGALEKNVSLLWSVYERRFKYKDYGTGLSIDRMSRLRIPLGSLEAMSILVILDGLRSVSSLEDFRDVSKLLVIDEFGVHCDPVLTQKLLDRIISETFSQEKLYTVIITHNPDILTRSLKLFEKMASRDKSVLDSISIHQFLWNSVSRSVDVDSCGVYYVDGIVTPSKKVKLFEESFKYMSA